MRIPLLYYKNSILASIVSTIGICLVFLGATFIFEIAALGIVFLLLGILLMLAAKNLSERKAFLTWWKQITDKKLEPRIREDVEFAILVYYKNPQKRTLRKIAKLNPEAAKLIKEP